MNKYKEILTEINVSETQMQKEWNENFNLLTGKTPQIQHILQLQDLKIKILSKALFQVLILLMNKEEESNKIITP